MSSNYTCSFCGTSELEAKRIVAKGRKDEPAICSDCVIACVNTLINTGLVSTINKPVCSEALGKEESPATSSNDRVNAGSITVKFGDAPYLGTA